MTPEQYAAAAQLSGEQWWSGVIALLVIGICVMVVGAVLMGLAETRADRQHRERQEQDR